jgi:hypothetical protein
VPGETADMGEDGRSRVQANGDYVWQNDVEFPAAAASEFS